MSHFIPFNQVVELLSKMTPIGIDKDCNPIVMIFGPRQNFTYTITTRTEFCPMTGEPQVKANIVQNADGETFKIAHFWLSLSENIDIPRDAMAEIWRKLEKLRNDAIQSQFKSEAALNRMYCSEFEQVVGMNFQNRNL